MSNKFRAFFISLSLLALLAFSAFGTIPAYADDGTTTGSTDTTTTTGTDQGTVTTDTGGQPTADTPPAADTTPLLEQVPDNTTVTVVDASGEALPLASQESADAVTLSDPIWCPATQTVPTPGQNGCTESYTSFTDLLNFLEANQGDAAYQVNGTIYVEQGTYQGGEQTIDFNTHNLNTLQQYDLTVTGGWNTTNNTVNSTSNFSVPIIIGSNGNPWTGSLTLNNIVVNGANQTGLTLNSDGNVELSNIEVTNSQNGVDINAGGNVTINNSNIHHNKQKGADITSGGGVDINKSEFSNNGSGDINNPTGSGLGIQSGGAVTLVEVAADNNQLFGGNITAGGSVSITQGFFDGNQGYYYDNGWQYTGYGLNVVTTQNIFLDSVTADDNYLYGANLQGATINVTNASFRGNSSDWNDPVGYGLNISSTDAVTLESVHADNNQVYGANITAANSVNISNSFFNGNQSYYWSGDKTYYGYGLQVSAPVVILGNVSANENNLLGAHIEGNSIILSNVTFSNNGLNTGLDLLGKGVEIVSTGNVSILDIVADNNELFGADIQAGGSVAIGASAGKTNSFSGQLTTVYEYDTPFTGSSNVNGGFGLRIVAPNGTIDLQQITATGNFLYGASLEGTNISIANGVFSSNGSGVLTYPVGFGLKVISTGTVSLNNVSASNNQLYGADIEAEGNVNIGAGPDQMNVFSGQQTVSFEPGVGLTFYGYGLTVYSKSGDITLSKVEANFNNLWGAKLDGMNIFINDGVFNNNVSDSNIFIDDTGLLINSRGTMVALNNVEAKNNRLIGATIEDDLSTSAVVDVYIDNSTFTGNAGVTCVPSWCPPGSQIYWGYGLNVVTQGLISLGNVNASNNNLFGANLQGSTVTVTDSTFDNNRFENGLVITATGDVTLTNVTATNNGANGVKVTSTGACIQVVGGTFTGNDLYGIRATGAPLALDGTQVFGGNGSGDVFSDNAGTCVIPTSVALPASANASSTTSSVSSTGNNTTTLNAGTTNNSTTVSSDSKKTKGKKVVAKHNKRKAAKVRAAKVRHGRR